MRITQSTEGAHKKSEQSIDFFPNSFTANICFFLSSSERPNVEVDTMTLFYFDFRFHNFDPSINAIQYSTNLPPVWHWRRCEIDYWKLEFPSARNLQVFHIIVMSFCFIQIKTAHSSNLCFCCCFSRLLQIVFIFGSNDSTRGYDGITGDYCMLRVRRLWQ